MCVFKLYIHIGFTILMSRPESEEEGVLLERGGGGAGEGGGGDAAQQTRTPHRLHHFCDMQYNKRT